MNAQEAANVLRPNFHLEQMPAEDRHHVIFVEAVAAELGVEPTPFNLHQVAAALDAADIHPDDNEYPKMLYSRQHHAVEGCEASTYDRRHDWCWAHVANEEQAKALGSGWIENPAELPPRGEMPLHAPAAASQPQPEPVTARSGITELTREEYEKIAAEDPVTGPFPAARIDAAKKWLADHPKTAAAENDEFTGY